MKNFKKLIAALLLVGVSANVSLAQGVGYIDYAKIQENYTVAKNAAKELDAKSLELQQYLVDKEKQYKSLDTPLKKKNFEEKTSREFKAKQDAFLKLKYQKEEQVYEKIKAAANEVLVEQKLDAVVDYRVIFVGGTDVTNLVLNKLNGKK
ncbi:OmpH family outer membrane protein [bacterium]|nr:OmpH family outer membrane protein [bacterium]